MKEKSTKISQAALRMFFKDPWWQPFNRFQVKIATFRTLKRLTGRDVRIGKKFNKRKKNFTLKFHNIFLKILKIIAVHLKNVPVPTVFCTDQEEENNIYCTKH
jgi:hypothetical protein